MHRKQAICVHVRPQLPCAPVALSNRRHVNACGGQKVDKKDFSGSKVDMQVSDHYAATKLPLLPPCFSSNFTSDMTMPRSAALHMS